MIPLPIIKYHELDAHGRLLADTLMYSLDLTQSGISVEVGAKLVATGGLYLLSKIRSQVIFTF